VIHSKYQRWNRILAGIILLISFIVYFDTMAPTVSYWDCGEFIATSYILGVPHPPGSPLYLILGRLFSMLPLNPDIAFRVNLMSPIVSALAVMLLYLIIVKVVAHWRKGIRDGLDALIAFGGALVGALTFAFTDSHWFNAVEAEVYAMSTFFTAIVIWLILHWSERADEPGNERYILIIVYMLGLAIGVHLLNLLTLPFLALTIYFRKLQFEWKTFLITIALAGVTFVVINNGIMKGLPMLAGWAGLSSVILVVVAVFGAMVWAVLNNRRLLSLIFTSVVLILIGYSSYSLIFIRSNQDPAIDENDPETVAAAISYLEREQYGETGQLPRRYDGLPPKYEVVGRPARGQEYSFAQNRHYMFYNLGKQWKFFWNYQVKKMYWRYFLWQFAGRGPSTEPGVTPFGANAREDGVDWTQFGLPLALILGIGGMVYHFYRDPKEAFSVLALYFMTGLAIIIYLNQNNPQPRERDYSYVGSFLAFSIWVGIGASAILEKLKQWLQQPQLVTRLGVLLTILMLLAVPGVMLKANYDQHDRSGNYVAWDYSYNLLQSCEPNAVLFTNGDNDTFPLWYLQEVEGIRKDVTVANLSLLNTPWYIRQLRDSRPKGQRFIRLTDEQIQDLTSGLQPWKTQKVRVPVKNDTLNPDGYIEWTLKPTFAGRALKVQDMMIIRIIHDSQWKYPIYFAVTVSPTNRLGLEKYLEMDGLTFRLRSHEVEAINPEIMYANLMTELGEETWSREFVPLSKVEAELDPGKMYWSREYQPGYLFRNLGNKDVYYNPQIVRLLQNYRSAYMQLAVHYYFQYQRLRNQPGKTELAEEDRQKALEILDRMSRNVPEETIPVDSKELYFQIGQIYSELGRPEKLRAVLEDLMSRRDLTIQDRIEYGQAYLQQLNDYERARSIFEELYATFQALEGRIERQGLEAVGLTRKRWQEWQRSYSKIVSTLVHIYQELDLPAEAELILTAWLDRNPDDNNARKMLEELQAEE
jgi:tetratricopeptide (TPR) repeat protein